VTETDTKPKAETKQETGPKPSSSEKPETPAETKKATGEAIAGVLKEITHPLRFFALALFIVEGILSGTLLTVTGVDRTIIVIGMISTILLVIFCVLFLAVFRPASLIGKSEKARAVGSKTLSEILDDPEPYGLLTNYYFNNKNWEKAKQCCDGALKLNPKNIPANYNMGRIHLEKHEFDEAIKSFNRVLKYNKNDACTWKALGDTYYDLNNYDEAIKKYTGALKLDRENGEVWGCLGDAYQQLGNSAEAKRCFSEARRCYSKAKTYAPS
jgi:tetratricopeptide (TPR) repeat protein